VIAEKPVVDRFGQLGMLPVGGSLATTEAYVQSEVKKWGSVVRSLGMRVE
jgi:hypothetical protein